MTRRVVVGVDGSSTAEVALAWALEVAACYGAQVEAVHVWRWPLAGPVPTVPDLPSQLAAAARSTVDTQLERALAQRPSGAPDVHALAHTSEGEPGPALVSAAADAELLVLGRHGQSNVSRRLFGQVLGSVAAHCLNRSPAPVVIVPHDVQAHVADRVVVGVDGSDASARALRWARVHAQAIGSKLVAVLTWQLTSLPAPSSATAGFVPPLPEWHAKAEHLLHSVCQAALGPDVNDVEQIVLHRPAAAGLLEFLTARDLLVLGDRGRGGFDRLLLGSVSRQCAEHAPCPVVVVPPRDRLTGPRLP
jgi:nucleotide-binding universal stress UspA family protein